MTIQLSSLGVLSFDNKQNCGDLDQHLITMVRLDLRRVTNETLMSSSEICCWGLLHLLHPDDTQLKKQKGFKKKTEPLCWFTSELRALMLNIFLLNNLHFPVHWSCLVCAHKDLQWGCTNAPPPQSGLSATKIFSCEHYIWLALHHSFSVTFGLSVDIRAVFMPFWNTQFFHSKQTPRMQYFLHTSCKVEC